MGEERKGPSGIWVSDNMTSIVQTSEPDKPGFNPGSMPFYLGKVLQIFKPQFPYLQNGDNVFTHRALLEFVVNVYRLHGTW